MPRYFVTDNKGNSAVLNISSIDEFPPRFHGSVSYIYNMDTGETLKSTNTKLERFVTMYFRALEAPEATTILASTRIGFERSGIDAMVWRIGFEASNGFSVPPVESLTPYVRRTDVNRATSIRDYTGGSQ